MKRQLTKKEALIKAESLCAKREYCIAEIKKKLYEWGVNIKDFEAIINSLVKDRFIDEKRYVSIYVRDKFKLNKWGRVKIECSLRDKNIDADMIQDSLEKINDEDYLNTCKELIISKYRTVKAVDLHTKKEKVIRFMLSRGFEADVIYKTFDNIQINNKL